MCYEKGSFLVGSVPAMSEGSELPHPRPPQAAAVLQTFEFPTESGEQVHPKASKAACAVRSAGGRREQEHN